MTDVIMAPAADMDRTLRTMSESFLLSDIVPQIGNEFNGGIWEDLESAVRGWVEQRGTLTIITGPVIDTDDNQVSYTVIGDNEVTVPTHFYKIVVDANDPNDIETLAFLFPHEDLSSKGL